MKIQLTQEHIQKAQEAWKNQVKVTTSCPIWQAVHSHFKQNVFVVQGKVAIEDDGDTYADTVALLDERANQVIKWFDREQHADPCEIEMEIL